MTTPQSPTPAASGLKFRKRPVTITAKQWFKDGDHPAVVMKSDAKYRPHDEGIPWCPTLEGGHIVTPGDWIITGVKGEHYPCKPDIFAMTYEPESEALAAQPAPGVGGSRLGLHFSREWLKQGIASDGDVEPAASSPLHESRFFIDHGIVHDRKTGNHLRGTDEYGDKAADLLAVLHELENEAFAWKYTAKAFDVSTRPAESVAQGGELLSRIGELIRTQDNRITSHPVFVVEQQRTIYAVDTDYDTDGFDWLDDDGVVSEKLARRLEALNQSGGNTGKYRRLGYKHYWEFVTACFTEQGCKDYLAVNGHNLKNPRTYVYSAYRNAEWIGLRELFATPTPATGSGGDAYSELVDAANEMMRQDAVQRATELTNPFMAGAADKLASALRKVGAR